MPNDSRRIVIVGATSAIASQCARLWVDGCTVELVLVGRDVQRTERVAADLRVRSPSSRIDVVEADFVTPQAIQALVDGLAGLGAIDIALIAHGSLPDQAGCQQDLADCQAALMINGVSPALFAEAFAGHMQRAQHGTLAVIGSVAGDRGRKSNYVYGAAKGMLARYVQGLQHRLAGSNVKVVLIKPGPTDTPMTSHLPKRTSFARVEDVAREIVKGIARGRSVVYAPGKWALIMMVIRHLPTRIFNRMEI